jgi:hypothetical protein
MTRGLVVDKVRGNVIKVDRHKYVKVAYHGFRWGVGYVFGWVCVGFGLASGVRWGWLILGTFARITPAPTHVRMHHICARSQPPDRPPPPPHRLLSREERNDAYNRAAVRDEFEEPDVGG